MDKSKWFKRCIWDRKPIPKSRGKRRSLLPEEKAEMMAPCIYCGEEDLRVIQLHHPDKEGKPLEVVPLCANCHVLYHYAYGRNVRVEDTKEGILELLDILSS